MYYLRARYYQPSQGRFWTMDTYQGDQEDPLSLHKYLYAGDDPVDNDDPSGNDYGDFGINLSSILQPLANVLLASAGTPGGLSLKQLGAFAPQYPVLVVTLPNGTQYMPKTKVKNSAQAAIVGVPINTPICIAVPPTANPQAMVDYWSARSFWVNEFAYRDYFKGGGAHDYKLKNAIWDAFGNFNFGACGEATGVPRGLLQREANKAHAGGKNNPINTADINSGFDAIAKGGKLSTKLQNIVPASSSPSP
jgi:hypothetical protein